MIGSLIFTHIENGAIEEEVSQLKKINDSKKVEKERLIQEFERRLNASINVTVFDELIKRVHNLTTKDKPNIWKFETGAHYAFTIVSTIGECLNHSKYAARI